MTMEDVYKNIFNCSLIVEKQRKTYSWLPLWSIITEYVYKILLFNRRSPQTTSEELFSFFLIFLQKKK